MVNNNDENMEENKMIYNKSEIDLINNKMKITLDFLQKLNLKYDVLVAENLIRYIIFYQEDMRWIGFIEGSHSFPLVAYNADLENFSYSFGFIDINENMKTHFFGTIKSPTEKDFVTMLTDSIKILNTDITPHNLSLVLVSNKYNYWLKKNKLKMSKLL